VQPEHTVHLQLITNREVLIKGVLHQAAAEVTAAAAHPLPGATAHPVVQEVHGLHLPRHLHHHHHQEEEDKKADRIELKINELAFLP
jgi:hypothetical protein